MGHGAISSALRASLVKTARKSVPPVKTVTTATPFTGSALTVTLAGLGIGKKTHTAQHMCVKETCILLFSQTSFPAKLYHFKC